MSTRKKTTDTEDAQKAEMNIFERRSLLFSVDAQLADQVLAISAGDYRLAFTQELVRTLSEHSGRPFAAAKEGLKRLLADRFISAQERRQLAEICDLVVVASGGGDRNAAITKVRTIYERMIIGGGASPVALAIASIAASMARPTQQPGTLAAAAAGPNRGDLGMVGGTIAGAVIGGLIGGAAGAVIGGVIGGIVGGVTGACSE